MAQKLSLVGLVLAAGITLAKCRYDDSFSSRFSERGPIAEKTQYQDSPACNDLIKIIIKDSQHYLLHFEYESNPTLNTWAHQIYRESGGFGFYCSRNEGKNYDGILFTPPIDNDSLIRQIKQGWKLAAIVEENRAFTDYPLYIWISRIPWIVGDAYDTKVGLLEDIPGF